MPVFDYRAMDLDGGVASGTVAADTARAARDELRDRGLTILEMIEVRRREVSRLWQRRRLRHTAVETTTLIRDLATLLRAGIALLPALKALERQLSRRLKPVVQDLGDRVAAGVSLADAMERHPAVFDELAVNIVRVGESTGSLDVSLRRLAEFRDKSHRLRSRVTSALLYPGVVCVIGLAVMVFLMTYVVPQLIDALLESDRPLPGVTRAVRAVSDLLVHWWWALLVGVVGIVVTIRLLLRREGIRRLVHRGLLRIPILGDLIAKENTSRMAVVLSGLLRSGLPFIEAIRITRRTLSNLTYRDAMETYEQAVAAGRDVAGPLEEAGVFKPMVVQMLAVGQQSGELEDMLDQLAETYDEEVTTAATRLTAMLEPLLIVVLAILVGFIAFATILPILEVSNVF